MGMKRIFSIIFGVMACFASLICWGTYPPSINASVNRTMENNIHIEKQFAVAAEFVENFKTMNNRFPTRAEFETWDKNNLNSNIWIETQKIKLDQDLYKNAREKFDTPPENSYILNYWRGEWAEHYGSWTRTSTMPQNKNEYFMLGTARRDFVASISLFLLLALTSIGLFLKSLKDPRTESIHNG